MPKITIKLLHERKSGLYRKIDGHSGKLYTFTFNEKARAYCFTTENQVEIDDIFSSQGRNSGCYYAPVITTDEATDPLTDALALELVRRGLSVTPARTINELAEQIVAAFDAGDAQHPLRGPDGRFTGEGRAPKPETTEQPEGSSEPSAPTEGAQTPDPDAAPASEEAPKVPEVPAENLPGQ